MKAAGQSFVGLARHEARDAREAGRCFSPVALGRDEIDPDVAALYVAARAHKQLRRLAKSAAVQLRHLVDIAAFEALLSGALTASPDRSISPEEWLARKVREFQVEQSQTRTEHARMAAIVVQRAFA